MLLQIPSVSQHIMYHCMVGSEQSASCITITIALGTLETCMQQYVLLILGKSAFFPSHDVPLFPKFGLRFLDLSSVKRQRNRQSVCVCV